MSHFFRYQKRAVEHFDADHSTMEDFATVLNGFPPEATDPTLLQAWIEKTCGFKIVGVSIGYNFTLDQSRVADMIERHTIVNDIAVGLYGKDDELAYDTTGDRRRGSLRGSSHCTPFPHRPPQKNSLWTA